MFENILSNTIGMLKVYSLNKDQSIECSKSPYIKDEYINILLNYFLSNSKSINNVLQYKVFNVYSLMLLM